MSISKAKSSECLHRFKRDRVEVKSAKKDSQQTLLTPNECSIPETSYNIETQKLGARNGKKQGFYGRKQLQISSLPQLVRELLINPESLRKQVQDLSMRIKKINFNNTEDFPILTRQSIKKSNIEVDCNGKTIQLGDLISKYQNLKFQNKKLKEENQVLKIKKKCGCSMHVKEDEIAKLYGENRRLEKKLKQITQKQTSQLKFKNQELKTAKNSLRSLKGEFEEIFIKCVSQQEKISSLQMQIHELEKKSAVVVYQNLEKACEGCAQNSTLKKNYQQVISLMEEMERQRDQYDSQIAELNGKLTHSEDLILILKEEVDQQKSKNSKVVNENAELLDMLNEAEQENRHLAQVYEQKCEQFKNIDGNVEVLVKQIAELNEKLREKNQEIFTLKMKQNKFETQLKDLFHELKNNKQMTEAVKYVSAEMIDSLVGDIRTLEKTNTALRKTLSNGRKEEQDDLLRSAGQIDSYKPRKQNMMFLTHYQPAKETSLDKKLSFDSDTGIAKSQ